MDAREIGEAISYLPMGRLEALAERCLRDAEVRIVSPPRPALVMAQVRETVDGEVFNLGEVLLTTCEVRLDGEPGWGVAVDDAPERALCAAVVDAATRREDAHELNAELGECLAQLREARRRRWAAVQPTRVEFEEMV